MTTGTTSSRTATAGTIVIAVLSFWLSFAALADLARMAGVSIPELWPLIVDGLIVTSTAAVVALERARWYGWTLLIVSAGISVVGNAIHSTLSTHSVSTPVAVGIACVPPIALLLSTHLTVLLQRTTSADTQVGPKEQAQRLLADGASRKQIAEALGVSESTAYRWTTEPSRVA
ncbi:DUF2637 domain-containing protein [Rhodococcus sp. IEGM 1330]|uniref:DUF2637 domain-containing protein n=1 Tax=Rhodococcus sp. IEGM 1330 TaxID=3082225 RepID=UPI002952A987|nr:DUF2637 domain-containing protein [Rhodococcus sp. IEGM 1330]MDV8022004.1 DUF2637 domain-containing protein [Rhodococcus sp. IEGM 1330]